MLFIGSITKRSLKCIITQQVSAKLVPIRKKEVVFNCAHSGYNTTLVYLKCSSVKLKIKKI
jgi:hypothetical protein